MASEDNSSNENNVGVALGLVCAAGASTGLGAAVVFFPTLVQMSSKRVLASSLGFSAGVMIYVSFVEIFSKSKSSFVDAGNTEDEAYIYSTFSFFLGMGAMMLLNAIVAYLMNHAHDFAHHHHHHHGHDHDHDHNHGRSDRHKLSHDEDDEEEGSSKTTVGDAQRQAYSMESKSEVGANPTLPHATDDGPHPDKASAEVAAVAASRQQRRTSKARGGISEIAKSSFVQNMQPQCRASDSVRHVQALQQMGNILENEHRQHHEGQRIDDQRSTGTSDTHSDDRTPSSENTDGIGHGCSGQAQRSTSNISPLQDNSSAQDRDDDSDGEVYIVKKSSSLVDQARQRVENQRAKRAQAKELRKKEQDKKDNIKLVRMGVNTALAIGLHNFPEGLATFVAALHDPTVGAVLAFAIAMHNIPEGLCVALPIYYATGNRVNAFCWAMVSGASEFVAALLGWAILANSFSDALYALLFGLVSGMMVIISVRELLPTAHSYDPADTVVTNSFVAGMALMAVSLVLFVL